mgnify:CR=1 FL=1
MPQLKYSIIVEQASGNYSAYSPQLVGCATTGKTVEECVANFKTAALEFVEDNYGVSDVVEIAPIAHVELATLEVQVKCQTSEN